MPDYVAMAVSAANRYGIDPNLFVRQINQESGFDPTAGSSAGAQGIAQIMPATARGWGVDPWDPEAALDAAAREMANYINDYGSWEKALWAYNAGPGAVDNYLPDETRTYLDNILGGGDSMPNDNGKPPWYGGSNYDIPKADDPDLIVVNGIIIGQRTWEEYPDGSLQEGPPKYFSDDVIAALNPKSASSTSAPRSTSSTNPYMNLGDGYVLDIRTGQVQRAYGDAAQAAPIGELPAGYAPIRDTRGNIIQGVQDPSYVSPIEWDQWANDYTMSRDASARAWSALDASNKQFDTQFDWTKQRDIADITGYYDENPTFAREQWDWTKGLSEGELTGMYNGAPTERRYEFDTTEQRMLDQFDAELGERIATREQRITELSMELTSLEKRADQQAAVDRAKISAQLSIAKSQQATDLAIAKMDSSTKLTIAKQQSADTQRGQDIDKLLGLRGQDVQWKLGQGELAQRGIESFAEMQGRDPFRASLMAYGDRGGTTPQEGLLSQMQGIYSSMQNPLPYDLQSYEGGSVAPVNAVPSSSANYYQDTRPKWPGFGTNVPGFGANVPGFDDGGVIESDEPVLSVVGERGPEAALLPPGSIVQPINADRGDSLSEMRQAAAEAMPAMRERARRAHMLAYGGVVRGAPTTNLTWMQKQIQSRTPEQQRLVGQRGNSWQSILDKARGVIPKPPEPVQPVSQPMPTYSNPYGLTSEGEATMANVLNRIFDPGANIRPGQAWGVKPEPLYGVDIPDPTQWAYTYTTRPINEQRLMTSAAGVVGWGDPEAQEERRRAVTPASLRPFTVGYGYDGLTIVPIAA